MVQVNIDINDGRQDNCNRNIDSVSCSILFSSMWVWIYQDYYTEHFLSNETSSSISWIGSVKVCFLFSGSLTGGPLFDRYGDSVRKDFL
ncbi:hypothetical protein ACN38_g3744 [Penicillium nordicum]|uniref:Major facilitator superfamily (MFS) profile domain-containing protein n=1 Tax=Penicillium nordicum TaxID=229535 RepID=A0A0M8P568_9EURO|nr:hypothetical protein ACN38_g3744 [Penicillium nordicum]